MRVILNGEHAIKSCFAGLYLDGFDFIQGVSWISSERNEDFTVAVQRFHSANRKRDNVPAINRFVISFCLYKGLGLAHKRLIGQMRCSHLVLLFEFAVKSITLNDGFLFLKNHVGQALIPSPQSGDGSEDRPRRAFPWRGAIEELPCIGGICGRCGSFGHGICCGEA